MHNQISDCVYWKNDDFQNKPSSTGEADFSVMITHPGTQDISSVEGKGREDSLTSAMKDWGRRGLRSKRWAFHTPTPTNLPSNHLTKERKIWKE